MRKGIFVLLYVVFVQVAMPSLCAAGVLGHACDCADSNRCHHESDCDSDPCAVTLARPSELVDFDRAPVLLPVIPVNRISVELHGFGLPAVRPISSFVSMPRRKRSYQSSGLPLQI